MLIELLLLLTIVFLYFIIYFINMMALLRRVRVSRELRLLLTTKRSISSCCRSLAM